MGCKPIFPSFPSPFSLSSLPMLSPPSKILLLLRWEIGWPAVTTAVAVGAAAPPLKTLFFQIFFVVSTSFRPLLISNTQNPNQNL